MRISIIGAGYVGLVTGLCFSEMGHEVLCIENDPEKIDSLRKGRIPIFEPGIEGLLSEHVRKGRFRVEEDPREILQTEITFLCVGTPSRKNGEMDLRFLESAAVDVGGVLREKEGYHVVVVKSTVIPTTTETTIVPILEKSSGKKAGRDFGVAMNPEFLKEGSALRDFMNPDRVVIGALDERSGNCVRSLYRDFRCPIVEVSLSTAEMIKVASNAFLATKISFINEIGNICKSMGIDVRKVAEGMGYDKRIGPQFLRAGCGFGGSCFPKDVSGLIAEAERRGLDPVLLRSVLKVNEVQPLKIIELLENRIKIDGKRIGVLGLSFKPDTDDIREARSRIIVGELLRKGAIVRAHDPKAIDNFRKEFPDVEYLRSAKECVEGCDAILIVTEWPEYADPSIYEERLVIDGRGVVKTNNYEGICW